MSQRRGSRAALDGLQLPPSLPPSLPLPQPMPPSQALGSAHPSPPPPPQLPVQPGPAGSSIDGSDDTDLLDRFFQQDDADNDADNSQQPLARAAAAGLTPIDISSALRIADSLSDPLAPPASRSSSLASSMAHLHDPLSSSISSHAHIHRYANLQLHFHLCHDHLCHGIGRLRIHRHHIVVALFPGRLHVDGRGLLGCAARHQPVVHDGIQDAIDKVRSLLAINRSAQESLDRVAQQLHEDEVATVKMQKRVRARTGPYRIRAYYPHFYNRKKETPPPDHSVWRVDPRFPKVDIVYNRCAWTIREQIELEKAILRHNQMKIYDETNGLIEESDEDLLTIVQGIDWQDISRMVGTRSPIECQMRWTVAQHPFINKDPFDKEELDELAKTIEKYKGRDWVQIATEHGRGRVSIQCLKAYRTQIKPRHLGVTWTREEDDIMRLAIEKYGTSEWFKIAHLLDGRTPKQCLHRWRFTIAPGKVKGRWSKEEDESLLRAVSQCGRGNWSMVARLVPTRTDMQCRERYENCLNPELNIGPFTPEETQRLKELVAAHGSSKWSLISKEMGTRTDNQCRRAWRAIVDAARVKKRPGRKPKMIHTFDTARAHLLLSERLGAEADEPSDRPADGRAADGRAADLLEIPSAALSMSLTNTSAEDSASSTSRPQTPLDMDLTAEFVAATAARKRRLSARQSAGKSAPTDSAGSSASASVDADAGSGGQLRKTAAKRRRKAFAAD
ncbi:hypothetical protein BC831DRAFT_451031 [Entophlyctis helioformis]|nr:hypothetical protein BC831DRAFT_451031 [Entophlyctis helioformis]